MDEPGPDRCPPRFGESETDNKLLGSWMAENGTFLPSFLAFSGQQLLSERPVGRTEAAPYFSKGTGAPAPCGRGLRRPLWRSPRAPSEGPEKWASVDHSPPPPDVQLSSDKQHQRSPVNLSCEEQSSVRERANWNREPGPASLNRCLFHKRAGPKKVHRRSNDILLTVHRMSAEGPKTVGAGGQRGLGGMEGTEGGGALHVAEPTERAACSSGPPAGRQSSIGRLLHTDANKHISSQAPRGVPHPPGPGSKVLLISGPEHSKTLLMDLRQEPRGLLVSGGVLRPREVTSLTKRNDIKTVSNRGLDHTVSQCADSIPYTDARPALKLNQTLISSLQKIERDRRRDGAVDERRASMVLRKRFPHRTLSEEPLGR
ncbi:unnamed protein product [Menidia menidia]|uniref:(Atlantic silverside) hypothetical protein n=1 Tax=Menidia menidia TaxID=238744 RepID=A0A8S4BN42_9TELE|nr:unnamed protein product [Menidia menidia]